MHPPGLLRRLVAVELHRPQAGAVRDLGDALWLLVAEHADGEDIARQPLDDVGDELRMHLAG